MCSCQDFRLLTSFGIVWFRDYWGKLTFRLTAVTMLIRVLQEGFCCHKLFVCFVAYGFWVQLLVLLLENLNWAIAHAMSFAVQHNFQSGFFVTDCMQVVSAFNGQVAEVNINLLDRLKSVCRAHHFQVYWFPRHALLRCNQYPH